MNFETLTRRVRRAEAVVEIRAEETTQRWDSLSSVWRSAWTPGRIVIVGLAGGFLAGKLEPGGAFSGGRWLQMIGSVSGLMTTAQGSIAAFKEAALAAAAAAAGVAAVDAAEEHSKEAHHESKPASRGDDDVQPPRAAEAATELSES